MSYTYHESTAYTYRSNYKYRARVGIEIASNTAKEYKVNWKIEVQAQHGYYYGMAVTGSGECSGTDENYLRTSPGETWKTVASVSNSKTYKKKENPQTKTFKAKAYGKVVDGIGSAGGSGVTATYDVKVPALDKYKITFNANGGTGGPKSQTKYYGKTLTLTTSKPTRTGYTFAGWYSAKSGGSKYVSSYTADKSATLYAHWTPIKYEITYNGNKSTSGSVDGQTKNYNEGVTIKNNGTNGYVRTGYEFVNWNTRSDGAGTTYKAGSSYKGNSDLLLYAQWRKNTFTVTYDATNCGSTRTTNTITVGTSFNLRANPIPNSTTYNFLGWTIDGTSVAASPYTSKVYSDITFTAVVAKIAEDSTVEIPIQIKNLQINRCTTNSGNADVKGGWAYKYSFDWECGKLSSNNSTTNQTPTTIKITDNNGYSTTFINGSTSSGGSCNATIVTDLANASILTITATGPSSTTQEGEVEYPYDSTVKRNIPYSNEDIEEITLDNIELYRTAKKIAGSFNWSTYYDGNSIHENYIFQFHSKKSNEEEYTDSLSIPSVSKNKSAVNDKIEFEVNLENSEIKEEEEIELAVEIVSYTSTIAGSTHPTEHPILSLGKASPAPTIIHINSLGNGVGVFTKVNGLTGFHVGENTSLLKNLTINGTLETRSRISALKGLQIPNYIGIRWNKFDGTDAGSEFHLNTSDNLIIGYPQYSKKIGSTQVYGDELYLYTNGGVHTNGYLYINNHDERVGIVYTNNGSISVVPSSTTNAFVKQTKATFKSKLGAGTWVITATLHFASNATGSRVMRIYINNTGYESTNIRQVAVSGGETRMQSTLVTSQSSDFNVYIGTYQSSGVNLTTQWYLRAVRIA